MVKKLGGEFFKNACKIISIARQGVDFRSDYVLNQVLKKNVLGTMGRLR